MATKQRTMYDIIKRQNGERFAKAVRAYDNGIFDIKGIDTIVKYAGHAAEPIMNYLVSLKKIQIENLIPKETPFELLHTAGYKAEYADTFEKQNSIKKYFKSSEALCTFKDQDRYKDYYIINAVKYNVNEIKRDDFRNPLREDDYGTSVISIQILKSGGFISIKNRYNHAVNNPDNTFSSNPDNIIRGLAASLKKYFNVDFSSQQESLPNGYVWMDNKILKYNYEIENSYVGTEFIAANGQVYDVDKNCEIMMDYFLFNLKTRQLKTPAKRTIDSFTDVFDNEVQGDVNKLQLGKDKNGHRILYVNGVPLVETADGLIVSLNLPNTEVINDRFLTYNKSLSSFNADKLIRVGDEFLLENNSLTELSLKRLEIIGDNFLQRNQTVAHACFPRLKAVRNSFMSSNLELTEVSFPEMIETGDNFIYNNEGISKCDLPKLQCVGKNFLAQNIWLVDLFVPELVYVKSYFLNANEMLENLDAPKLTDIEDCFLFSNRAMKNLSLLNLVKTGRGFMWENRVLEGLMAPNLKTVGPEFLKNHERMIDSTKNPLDIWMGRCR